MAIDNIQELLQLGIQAAKQGNPGAARRLLLQVVEQAPNNELAWIWLASVAETIGQRRSCLERVLAINPNNQRAKQALEKIELSTSATEESRPTPQLRRDRPALDRDAAIRTTRRRRRGGISPFSYAVLAILGLMLIGLGFILLWNENLSDETATPTLEAGAVANLPTLTPTRSISPTPSGPTNTPRPPQSPPPTWTPTATETPTIMPTDTPSPPPLSSYKLLFTWQNSDKTVSELHTLAADGTQDNLIPITVSQVDQAAGLTLAGVFDAAYSPDGAQIVFSAQLPAAGGQSAPTQDLFVVAAEGGEVQRLTTLQASHVEDATWSPDGEQIAFASDVAGDFNIYVVSIDGGTPVRITDYDGEDRDPAWSPVSDTIVFATDLAGPGELEIYSMSSSGDNLTRLTDNTNDSYAPAWSRDGQRIAFVSTRRANNDLYVMEADGLGESAILVRDIDADEFDPAWSPDGEWIAFSSNRAGTTLDLFLIRPDGSQLERLTVGDNTNYSQYPDWTPR